MVKLLVAFALTAPGDPRCERVEPGWRVIVAREKAAIAASRPDVVLDLRRQRARLSGRLARECLPRWYPTFPSGHYLTAVDGGAGHLLRPDERARIADHLAHRAEDADRGARCYESPNFAYREVSHWHWHSVRPWERTPTLQWAVDALARGDSPDRVRCVLETAARAEYKWDVRPHASGLALWLHASGLESEARWCLLFYHRGLYNPHYEGYLRERERTDDPVRTGQDCRVGTRP